MYKPIFQVIGVNTQNYFQIAMKDVTDSPQLLPLFGPDWQ